MASPTLRRLESHGGVNELKKVSCCQKIASGAGDRHCKCLVHVVVFFPCLNFNRKEHNSTSDSVLLVSLVS